MRWPFSNQSNYKKTPPPSSAPSGFNLDQTLLTLHQERFTIRDACQGVQVFGGTGSGKTSGSGRALALSYLAYGFGGLVYAPNPMKRNCGKTSRRKRREKTTSLSSMPRVITTASISSTTKARQAPAQVSPLTSSSSSPTWSKPSIAKRKTPGKSRFGGMPAGSSPTQ